MSFQNLGLSKDMLASIAANAFTKPYPIQEKAIPAVVAGKDVLGIAKTGSGKTASYALPILQKLLGASLTKTRSIHSLVLVPTRELAVQVQEVFHSFSKHLSRPVRTMAVYGGVSINPQMKALFGTQVLVATPGRLLELVENKAITISNVETLVLDEADKMLNLGFKAEIDAILAMLPKKRQNLLFSATLSDDLSAINQVLLRDPVTIKVLEKSNHVDQIEQLAYLITDEKKGPLLRHLIATNDWKQVLVFTSSVYKADNVADKLRKNKISASAIHSKKSQGARKQALDEFKKGGIRVLVTTDLLSRGIDIEQLPVVINYELPRSPKDYVHRIGRTGRADQNGEAISLVCPDEEHHFKIIQKKMKKQVDQVDGSDLI